MKQTKLMSEWITLLEHLVLAFLAMYVFLLPDMPGTLVINLILIGMMSFGGGIVTVYLGIYAAEAATSSKSRIRRKYSTRASILAIIDVAIFLAFVGLLAYGYMLEGEDLMEALTKWQIYTWAGVSVGLSGLGSYLSQDPYLARLPNGANRR
jgi:F0F1-type ATP synthase membrane subunit c/vacuolar-type H+-ATPase subunit K